MMRALWSASTGMKGQELNIAVVSNNLSNVTTTGFKKSRVDFQDLMYQTITEPGAPISADASYPVGIQVGHGVKPVATQRMFTQGEFQQTDQALDVVIEGDGFFQIQLPNGDTAYTRDGAWKLSGDGTIVTSDGYTVLPEVQVPAEAIGLNITSGGIIAVKMSEDADLEVLGQIELADFVNPAGLKSIGNNLYQQSGSSGEAVVGIPNTEGFGSIAQGFTEMANVKVVEEMVNMIVAQRAYEANSKTIQTSDSMLQIANNLKK
ncbi:MAG: flagellar basal-body rod protein FlgG [Candidatus Riflebacteria bacterium]|jgi:flagellar basal-body rod protein FlgG|nr:flagellar basal-body rod protein FlgG [Candidatus Riflebacteria bacterium]MDD3377517.1 flagellar basal-body rod protein FlgG [Candidatus Riflebacteria bacterium]NCB46195.1 flagellar basal-body rod protein FlgG [bacterium]NLV94213.1 flagellar basal-body rod protein FlgG [Candidatus Riflebacteria bacterium]